MKAKLIKKDSPISESVGMQSSERKELTEAEKLLKGAEKMVEEGQEALKRKSEVDFRTRTDIFGRAR